MSFESTFDFPKLKNKIENELLMETSEFKKMLLNRVLDQMKLIDALTHDEKLKLYNLWSKSGELPYKYMARMVESYDLFLDPNDDTEIRIKTLKEGESIRSIWSENETVIRLMKDF